jgi:hypothetical protein
MGGGGPAQTRRPPASGSRVPPVCGYRVGLPLVPMQRRTGFVITLPRSPRRRRALLPIAIRGLPVLDPMLGA